MLIFVAGKIQLLEAMFMGSLEWDICFHKQVPDSQTKRLGTRLNILVGHQAEGVASGLVSIVAISPHWSGLFICVAYVHRPGAANEITGM